MENEKDGKFLKGLFCGVALTLACMALSLGWMRWKLTHRDILSGTETETVEDTAELNLDNWDIYRKTNEIQYLINEGYTGEIDTQHIEDNMFRGLVNGLDDPYSEYYSIEDMALMEESTSGTYSGIGVTLMQDPQTEKITVVSCFENTPATEAGILPGDIVTGLKGEPLGDMSLTELVNTIKTDESETIELTLERDGKKIETVVTRREIEIPTVSEKMLEDKIGYIRILEFDTVTVEQFEQALDALEKQGMEKLIIDVRDNPGGVLQVVCDILDRLLPEGLIVYTEDKQGERTEYYSDEEHKFEKPLVVLINENSASASEIFAGAIKDYDAGTLVGVTTFGKGIVQRIYNLSDGTGMKLTIANYYTPKGEFIHKKGIEPDVVEELDEDVREMVSVPEDMDNQLQKAIEIIKNK
ncbi:MAG: S41 family peptidase [Eubacteriales bacterium]|nr:S41 family peptidase [Eubacteriales bacterium]